MQDASQVEDPTRQGIKRRVLEAEAAPSRPKLLYVDEEGQKRKTKGTHRHHTRSSFLPSYFEVQAHSSPRPNRPSSSSSSPAPVLSLQTPTGNTSANHPEAVIGFALAIVFLLLVFFVDPASNGTASEPLPPPTSPHLSYFLSRFPHRDAVRERLVCTTACATASGERPDHAPPPHVRDDVLRKVYTPARAVRYPFLRCANADLIWKRAPARSRCPPGPPPRAHNSHDSRISISAGDSVRFHPGPRARLPLDSGLFSDPTSHAFPSSSPGIEYPLGNALSPPCWKRMQRGRFTPRCVTCLPSYLGRSPSYILFSLFPGPVFNGYLGFTWLPSTPVCATGFASSTPPKFSFAISYISDPRLGGWTTPTHSRIRQQPRYYPTPPVNSPILSVFPFSFVSGVLWRLFKHLT
ncbi:hypothetical protein MVEN_00728200 [Mycena venus]|uniref:Uncharacterized protein n=1 Tax=Mycena venus TaxID=2733690 RepID=A0A8H6YHR6_9AGAR|nr:hypothetical protein MVEN_00728200 [Mycena venus]